MNVSPYDDGWLLGETPQQWHLAEFPMFYPNPPAAGDRVACETCALRHERPWDGRRCVVAYRAPTSLPTCGVCGDRLPS